MPRANYIPVKEVVSLAKEGLSDAEIVRNLREQGFSSRQINDAFNQVKIKAASGELGEEMEPSIMQQEPEMPVPEEGEQEQPVQEGYEFTPAPTQEMGETPEETAREETFAYPQFSQESRPSTEVIEEIAEEIINEKWESFKTRVGDFSSLRKYFEDKMNSLSLRTKRIENSLEKMQDAVVTKIRETDSELRTLRAELHALETAFSKILEPLVSNIRKIEQGTVQKEVTRLKKREQEEEEDKLESKLRGKKK